MHIVYTWNNMNTVFTMVIWICIVLTQLQHMMAQVSLSSHHPRYIVHVLCTSFFIDYVLILYRFLQRDGDTLVAVTCPMFHWRTMVDQAAQGGWESIHCSHSNNSDTLTSQTAKDNHGFSPKSLKTLIIIFSYNY